MRNVWPGAEVRVPESERISLDPGEFFQIGPDRLRGGGPPHRRDRSARLPRFDEGGGTGLLVVDNDLLIPFARSDLRGDRSRGASASRSNCPKGSKDVNRP